MYSLNNKHLLGAACACLVFVVAISVGLRMGTKPNEVPDATAQVLQSITRISPRTNVLTNGDKDLSLFKITPGVGEKSYITRIVFKLSKNSGVGLRNFRLKKGTADVPVSSYAIQYATTTNRVMSLGSGSIGSTSGTTYLIVTFKKLSATKPAGDLYTLRATVSGVTAGKYVATSFYVNKTVPPPDADKGFVPPPDADKGVVPPPDADSGAMNGFFWTESLVAR